MFAREGKWLVESVTFTDLDNPYEVTLLLASGPTVKYTTKIAGIVLRKGGSKVYRFVDEQSEYIFKKWIKGTGKVMDNVPASLLKGSSNTHVYFGVKNGKINYVGISKDPAKRAAQHGDRFERLDILTDEPLTRRQARAIEQALINRNPNYSNKINSISPEKSWYKEAVDWGDAWLKERGY